MQTNRNIFLWALYDFANSIVSMVFILYFAQWIVVDRGVADFTFNLAFTVSAFLLLCTAPLAGAWADKSGRRITGLRYTTVLTALLYGACAWSAIAGKEITALVLFTLGLYMYLLSFSFYTPLLADIAAHTKRGLVSGIGIAANYAGQFVGLVLVLPFATGAVSLFGAEPRAETLLPGIVVFFIFALPMLLFFEEPHKRSAPVPFAKKLLHTIAETKALFRSASVALFLLSFFFFNDAILTLSINFPIFLEQVWHITDTTKTYLLLAVLVTCALGGIVAGPLADRFGQKRVLLIILSSWIVLLPALGYVRNFTLFVVLTIFMGLWFGANWAVARSMMSHVAPRGRHNLAFTYFSIAERASSFIGPIAWGAVVTGLVSWGSERYRFGVLVLMIFIVLGMFSLRKVKLDEPRRTQAPAR